MKIQESAENYLESILRLELQKGEVHGVDIARDLDFTKPSVSRAMARLREAGEIETDAAGRIALTPAGRAVASEIYARHCVLTDFLVSMGVPRPTAVEDACRMEHDISPVTFGCIRARLEADKAAAPREE